jgi:hypothetical protein
MYQSTFDYPYLSSSANHLFDITLGFHTSSGCVVGNCPGVGAVASTACVQRDKKVNVYNSFAQVLVGTDTTGNVKQFTYPNGRPIKEAYFVTFSRLLVKDEIKKGSFTMNFVTSSVLRTAVFNSFIRQYKDNNAQNNYYTNSPAGEYSVVSGSVLAGGQTPANVVSDYIEGAGLLYYQAGVLVLCASQGMHHGDGTVAATKVALMSASFAADDAYATPKGTMGMFLTGANISSSVNVFRHRIQDITFNNTTELNSTIYFCRAGHNDFNYSSNPTYLSESKMRVKNSSLDQPVSYITTVGLYSPDNELLACAKLSEPIKKTPDTELTLRVRLDY